MHYLVLFLLCINLIAATDWSSYFSGLYSHLTSHDFKVNGKFYKYDFNHDGTIAYNDWIYRSSSGAVFRLLGEKPTQDNIFGWQRLESFPDSLEENSENGYFVNIRWEQDEDLRFSWLYISKKSGKVYKLVGAKPDNTFRYLDYTGDSKIDALPALHAYILDDKVQFTYDCTETLPGQEILCPNSSTSSSLSSSSSEPTLSSASSSGHCNMSEYSWSSEGYCGGSGECFKGYVDKFIIHDGDVKLYKITNAGNFTLVDHSKVYWTPEPLHERSYFLLCENNHCNLEDNAFYIIEITGGCDFDPNLDGVVNQQGQKNRSVLRAIVKGSWLHDGIWVSIASELLYERMLNKIFTNYNQNFLSSYNNRANELFLQDINGDGVIDAKDSLMFHYDTDRNKFIPLIQENLPGLLHDVHRGDAEVMNIHSYTQLFPDTLNFVNAMKQSNDELYVANQNKIYRVDISNPQYPTITFVVNAPKYVTSLEKVNGGLYIGTLDGLYFYGTQMQHIPGITGRVYSIRSDDRGYIYALTINTFYKIQNNHVVGTYRIDSARFFDFKIDKKMVPNFTTPETHWKYIAYIAAGYDGVVALDVTAQPTYIKHTLMNGTLRFVKGVAIDYDANRIYACDGDGVVILDRSNLQILYPPIVLPGYGRDMVVIGNLLYVADEAGGLQIIDKTTRRVVGFVDTPDDAWDIGMKDNQVFINDGHGLYRIDVTKPIYKDFTLAPNLFVNGPKNLCITLAKDREWLYCGTNGFVKQYRNMVFQKAIHIEGYYRDIAMTPPESQYTKELFVLTVRNGRGLLSKINLGNPNGPIYVPLIPVGNDRVQKVRIDRDGVFAYVMDNTTLHKIRINFPPQGPAAIGEENNITYNSVKDFALNKDGYIYLIVGSGMKIIEAQSMQPVESFDSIEKVFQKCAIMADHTLVVYATSINSNDKILLLYDINNPRNPVSIGDKIPLRSKEIKDITPDPDGNYIFIAGEGEGIEIIKKLPSGKWKNMGFFNTLGWVQNVIVEGNDLYYSDSHGGFGKSLKNLFEPF
ncbi:hypothetical protein NitYY0826_C1583 [Nitratiruptor sp. YY08-26]|uniref:hypothetical protein n=1 Tax=unclassified Nitratiruptor TaxID=2624044 RepID=UPI00191690E3|nr:MULTISPECIES: hypothetical protein [unclassified Nitratiruptor]BCD62700.1 hypothetical protein NitYY0813_C1581 [Nitratiruptor sp. YY08-13]BCD66636.1 hypothetical protein NitYY0826_C1583 [Nitratiruptor sp. YY08-26]